MTFKAYLLLATIAGLAWLSAAAAPQRLWEEQCPKVLKVWQTFSNKCNNLNNPNWAALNGWFRRLTPRQAYKDPLNPNPRHISHIVCDQDYSMESKEGLNVLTMAFGQFVNHELHTVAGDPSKPWNIKLPKGEPLFKKDIPFNRMITDPKTGGKSGTPLKWVNVRNTATVDGSSLYGVTEKTSQIVRGPRGTLKTEDYEGQEFPPHADELPLNMLNPNNKDSNTLFACGDFRCNENPGLTALHIIMVREHNWWARWWANKYPKWSDDQIFEGARKMMRGLIQKLTEDWLKALGIEVEFTGYNPKCNPDPALEFGVAAMRIGHSQVANSFWRVNKYGEQCCGGHIPLKKAYFNSGVFYDHKSSMDAIIYGLYHMPAQHVDPYITSGLRNYLFGMNLDLAAMNIMRGRDVGLGSYNSVRRSLGLQPAKTWGDISSDPEIQKRLHTAYNGNIEDVDLWIGGISEDHAEKTSMGETFKWIWEEWAHRMVNCDRWWYENKFALSPNEKEDSELRDMIEALDFNDIVARNSNISVDDLPTNPWFTPAWQEAHDVPSDKKSKPDNGN